MVKKEATWVMASGWLFIIGIIISVIAGLFPVIDSTTATTILSIIGFIIGILAFAGVSSIEKTDVNMFLLAVVAMMAAGGAGNAFKDIMYIGTYLMQIVNYIGIMVVPAAVLVALKAIWKSAQTKF